MSIGERLKKARKFRNVTQNELAKSLECSRGVVTNIEYDKIVPTKIIINAISETLHVRSEWLENGTGEMIENPIPHSSQIISEINSLAKDFSEEEQEYLLELIKSFKNLKDKSSKS